MSKADVLKDIEPVAQMDIWDGEMKIYESMAEYNKQIKRMRYKNNWFIAFSLARAIKSMKKIGEAFRSLGTSTRNVRVDF